MIKFTKTYEWARIEGDGNITIGITDRAQHALGNILYIELPEEGEVVNSGQECALIESVKTATDVYAPLSGKIVTINKIVLDNPAIINDDPENGGWLFKIHPSNPKEFRSLLNFKAYKQFLADTAN